MLKLYRQVRQYALLANPMQYKSFLDSVDLPIDETISIKLALPFGIDRELMSSVLRNFISDNINE